MINKRPHHSDDPVDDDYTTIREALSAKPAILQAILNASKIQIQQNIANTLKYESATNLIIPKQLSEAEKRYQAQISLQSDKLFTLYQSLPIDRKIDLLMYAEEIGEMNEQARKLATKKMQTELDKAMVLRQEKETHKISSSQTQMGKNHQSVNSLKKIIPATPEEDGLINQIGLGSPAAVTINLPFTVIPGLPALSKILEKIDKTTHFDLGFTIKGIADRAPNPNGNYDLLYRLSYVGTGIMSSKFNVQVAPIALKIQESVDQDKWGGNTSIFTKHKADNTGEKFSVNFNGSDGSISYAHEYSYQKPSNKIISTLTGGHHFSRDTSPALRIPAEFILTADRIIKALPDKKEACVIFDRIDKVMPMNQAYQLASSTMHTIDTIINNAQLTLTASIYLLKQKIEASGLSAEAQAKVFARACENCESMTKHGVLPIALINENSLAQQIVNAEQTQP